MFMDQHSFIELIFAIIGFLGSFILKAMWDTLKELEHIDKEHNEKLSSIEIHIASKYVTKDEVSKLLDAISAKLDKIENKLDSKLKMSIN
jgi:hypothetical protein